MCTRMQKADNMHRRQAWVGRANGAIWGCRGGGAGVGWEMRPHHRADDGMPNEAGRAIHGASRCTFFTRCDPPPQLLHPTPLGTVQTRQITDRLEGEIALRTQAATEVEERLRRQLGRAEEEVYALRNYRDNKVWRCVWGGGHG